MAVVVGRTYVCAHLIASSGSPDIDRVQFIPNEEGLVISVGRLVSIKFDQVNNTTEEKDSGNNVVMLSYPSPPSGSKPPFTSPQQSLDLLENMRLYLGQYLYINQSGKELFYPITNDLRIADPEFDPEPGFLTLIKVGDYRVRAGTQNVIFNIDDKVTSLHAMTDGQTQAYIVTAPKRRDSDGIVQVQPPGATPEFLVAEVGTAEVTGRVILGRLPDSPSNITVDGETTSFIVAGTPPTETIQCNLNKINFNGFDHLSFLRMAESDWRLLEAEAQRNAYIVRLTRDL